MPLPFTVTIVPPSRADLKRVVRSRVTWLVATLLLFVACASVFAVLRTERSGPPPRSGHLLLVGVPSDATITVDGQPLPTASPILSLPAGEHVVTFHGERIVDRADTVVVRPAQTTTLAPDLWLRHPSIAQLRPTYPGAAIVGASFLADGRIALVEALPPGDDDQLWLIDPSRAPRQIGPVDPHGAIALSPDGRHVAYLLPGQTATAKRDRPDALGVAGLGSEDGRPVFALPPDHAGENLADLSWAPDGRHLLVVSRLTDGTGGHWTRLRWLDLANGNARELVTFPGQVVVGSYLWSSNGSRVAFLTRLGQTTSLCALDPASATFQDVADLDPGEVASFPFVPAAWSSDGQRLVYTARIGTFTPGGLFGVKPAMDLDAVAFPRLISKRLGSGLGQFPALRADGAVIVIDHPRSNAPYTVRGIEPSGQPRDLFTINAPPSSAFTVLWDLAHDQAILATRAESGLGSAQNGYWLVRFGVEGTR